MFVGHIQGIAQWAPSYAPGVLAITGIAIVCFRAYQVLSDFRSNNWMFASLPLVLLPFSPVLACIASVFVLTLSRYNAKDRYEGTLEDLQKIIENHPSLLPQIKHIRITSAKEGANFDVGRFTHLTTLNLSRCSGLTSLYLGGSTELTDLDCSGCEGLTTLDLGGCRDLTHLNLGLCRGLTTLDLSACTELTQLTLIGCRGLTTLDFSACTELTDLYCSGWEDLTTLDLSACTELTTLDLSYWDNLTSLPENIFSLPSGCSVVIENTGISESVLDSIRTRTSQEDYEGPRIDYSMAHQNHHGTERTIEESLTLIKKHVEIGIDLSSLTRVEEPRLGHLCSWLHRLNWTASAQSPANKPFFETVCRILERAAQDPDYATIFWVVLEQASTTCGDRVALSVLQLDIKEQIAAALKEEAIDFGKLKKLLIHGQMAMGVLEEFGDNKIRFSRAAIDPIEVYLGLFIQLKQELELPFSQGEMLYFRCSNLTEEDLQNAKDLVLQDIKDPIKVLEYLETNDAWQEALIKSDPGFRQARKDYQEDKITSEVYQAALKRATESRLSLVSP